MKRFILNILCAGLVLGLFSKAGATSFIEEELNNTFETGQVIGSHDGTIVITGSRVEDDSVDYYKFFANAGDVITAATDSPTGACFFQDPMQGLFGPTGSSEVVNDDSGATCNSFIGPFTITISGLWGLAVGGFADFGFSGGGSNGWTYTTTITGLTPEVARVPEPSTLLLLGAGLLGVSYYARRQLRTIRLIGQVSSSEAHSVYY